MMSAKSHLPAAFYWKKRLQRNSAGGIIRVRGVIHGSHRRRKEDQEHPEKEEPDPPGGFGKERHVRHRDQRDRAERVVPDRDHPRGHRPGSRRLPLLPFPRPGRAAARSGSGYAKRVTPLRGHAGERPQRLHRGTRATQTCRPCQPSRVANFPPLVFGTAAARSSSIRPGSFERVRPSRKETRPTCVSTGRASAPKQAPRRTAGDFLPTPGSAVRSSMLFGTRPPCRETRAAEIPLSALALFR